MVPIAERDPWVRLLGDYDDEPGSVCCDGHECLHSAEVAEILAPTYVRCLEAHRAKMKSRDPTGGAGPHASAEAMRVFEPKTRQVGMHGAEPTVQNRGNAIDTTFRKVVETSADGLKQLLASEGSPVGHLCDRALMKVLQVTKAFLHDHPTKGGRVGVSIKERVGRVRQVRAQLPRPCPTTITAV
jgi:hypothetical protein